LPHQKIDIGFYGQSAAGALSWLKLAINMSRSLVETFIEQSKSQNAKINMKYQISKSSFGRSR